MEDNQKEPSSSDTETEDVLSQLYNADLIRYLCSILNGCPPRLKLQNYNTIGDVLKAINDSSSILVVCGAGVSVSCGIPDFRSKNGLYSRIGSEYSELSSPAQIFSLDYFRSNPHPFFRFCRDLFFNDIQPGVAHRFIRSLEEAGKLLNCYTQNVDGLDKMAGVERLIECHGTHRTSTCMNCKFKEDTDKLYPVIFDQKVPTCSSCGVGVMKPDIVFFGEDLSAHFHTKIAEDVTKCDLLVVIGSSMTVSPVSSIPRQLPHSVPQILVNRQSLPGFTFDVQLLGDCDVVLSHLALLLGDGYSHVSSLENIPEEMDVAELNEGEITRDDVYYYCSPGKYYYMNAEDLEEDYSSCED